MLAEAGDTEGCEHLMRVLRCEPRPPQEQCVLLTAETSLQPLNLLSFFFSYYIYLFVFGGRRHSCHMCGGQRTAMWVLGVLGVELRLSEVEASAGAFPC